MELNNTKCKHFESSFKEGRCPFIEVCSDNCVFVWKNLYDIDILEKYKDLKSGYDDLEDSYDTLQTRYNAFEQEYDSLQDDYNNLEKDYETLCNKIENEIDEGDL